VKPSEIKVSKLERTGEIFATGHSPHGTREDEADPATAIKTAEDVGYQVIEGPRRKPKHFEVLGKKGGEFEELHIVLDGGVRKTKPVSPHDHKCNRKSSRHAPCKARLINAETDRRA
jgi:hypothetical protein